MNRTIGHAFDSGKNNFDVIRIIAALMVLVSHSYSMTGSKMEPFRIYLGNYCSGGSWGVAIFFVISGFLVTRSCLVHSTLNYFFSRALRILPALLLVTIFEYAVIGPLFTELNLSDYFSYAKSHLLNVFIFKLEFNLPGIFKHNPTWGVNWSLWTLPVETMFYIILPIMCAFGALNRRVLLALVAILAVYYAYGLTVLGWTPGNEGGTLFLGVQLYSAVRCLLLFLAGSLLYLYRERIVLNAGMAIFCFLLLYISAGHVTSKFAFHVAVPYLVIFAALWRPVEIKAYKTLGDLSYGTYLFAYPIQQSVVAMFGAGIGPIGLMLIATPIVLCVAALSWRFVEKPSLQLRRKLLNSLENKGAAMQAPSTT